MSTIRQRTSLSIAIGGGVALIAAFLIAPLLVVLPMSFSDSTLMQFPPSRLSLRWYRAYFGDHAWIDATWTRVLNSRACSGFQGGPPGAAKCWLRQLRM